MPDLERKTENAFIDWFAATSTHGVTVGIAARYAAEDDTDNKTLPALWINAVRQQELAPETGVYQIQVDTSLEVNMDDTSETTATAYMTSITDLLQWDILASSLSARLTGFKVYGIESRGPCSKEIDGRIMRWTYPVTIWAHEGDS
jgi:hypothetical protein